MTTDYSLRDAAIAAYVQWLANAERKLSSRPTPRCSAPDPYTTRATRKRNVLDNF